MSATISHTNLEGGPNMDYLIHALDGSGVFFPQQREAAYNIYHQFNAETPCGLLIAPMQSGKTTAFMLTSFLMLGYGRVQNVIILCGNDENELYNQLTGDWEYSLESFLKLCPEVHEGRSQSLLTKKNFGLYKSSHLDKITIKDHTLIIWDESHFAQDIKNKPYKMFERNGLLVNGTDDCADRWNRKSCYLLSVSATPFSEKTDIYDERVTRKFFNFMHPGDLYRGVGFYKENDFIHIIEEHPDFKEILLSMSAKNPDTYTYGLVRTSTTKDKTMIERSAQEAGWDVIYYDSANKHSLGKDGINSLVEMPRNHTIIILKSMCRMGKVVPKQHISFVYEYAKNGNTDSALQSLLGRMCGYGPFNPNGIHIFVSRNTMSPPSDTDIAKFVKKQEKARREYCAGAFARSEEEITCFDEAQEKKLENFKKSEIDRYIEFMKCKDMIPTKAKNVVASKRNMSAAGAHKYYVRPFAITRDTAPVLVEMVHKRMNQSGTLVKRVNANFSTEDRRHIVNEVRDLVTRDIGAFGDEKQREEVLRVLALDDALNHINFHDVTDNKHGEKKMGTKLKIAMEIGAPYVNDTDKQLAIVYNSDRDQEHYFALSGYTHVAGHTMTQYFERKYNIPHTTGEEAFNPTHTNLIDVTPDVIQYDTTTATTTRKPRTPLVQWLLARLVPGKRNLVRIPKGVKDDFVEYVRAVALELDMYETKHTKSLNVVFPGRGRPSKYVEHTRYYFDIYAKVFVV
jgi:hypothetical protein